MKAHTKIQLNISQLLLVWSRRICFPFSVHTKAFFLITWVLQSTFSELTGGWKWRAAQLLLKKKKKTEARKTCWIICLDKEREQRLKDPPFAATNPEKHVMRPPTVFKDDIFRFKKTLTVTRDKHLQRLSGGCSPHSHKRAPPPQKQRNAEEHLAPNCCWSQVSFKHDFVTLTSGH